MPIDPRGIDTTTPVVVFRADTYGALGIIRSLGRLGVKVCAIDHEPLAYGFLSRYCHRHFQWDFESGAEPDSVDFLRKVASSLGGRPLLIPTFDKRSLFVDRNRDALASSFLMPSPDPGSMAALYSKQSLFEICRRLGIPTAFSVVPKSLDDLRAACGQFEFPVVLKAIDPDRLIARAGIRLVIARDRQELESLFARLDEPESPNLVVQEYIPGDDGSNWSMAAYYDGRSRCRFAITGRKLRQYPIHGGVTTLGICQPCSPLLESGQRIVEGTGYRGIAGFDFRHDARDGKYKLLDFNPRPGANARQYVDSLGMDVVRALYLDLTGQPITVGSPIGGRKWIVEDLDLWAMRAYRKEGMIGMREWLASLRGIREFAHVAFDDPRPSLRFCAATAAQIAASALRRLTGSRS